MTAWSANATSCLVYGGYRHFLPQKSLWRQKSFVYKGLTYWFMNAQVRYRPMRRTDLAVRVCLGRVNQKKPFCGHVMSEASRLSNDSVLLPTLHRHRQKGSTLDIFQIKPTCLPRYSHSPFSYNHLGHACSLFIHNLGYAWSLFRPSLGPQQFIIINLHVKLLLQNPPHYWSPQRFQIPTYFRQTPETTDF